MFVSTQNQDMILGIAYILVLQMAALWYFQNTVYRNYSRFKQMVQERLELQ